MAACQCLIRPLNNKLPCFLDNYFVIYEDKSRHVLDYENVFRPLAVSLRLHCDEASYLHLCHTILSPIAILEGIYGNLRPCF